MIRRDGGDEILLITQHDHALLAGQMLRRVGNALFSPPGPLQPVFEAVSGHDCGWRSRDRGPALTLAGVPAHVFEITLSVAIGAWAESVETVAKDDPYAGLLVSLHGMHLAAGAAASAGRSVATDEFARRDRFQLQQFLLRQSEIQEGLRRRLGMRIDLPLSCGLCEEGLSDDDDLLRANFHLLKLMDQLSLVLCFDRLVFNRISEVYTRPMGDSVTIRVDRPRSGLVRIHPWPFDAEKLDLQVPVKRLKNRRYQDADIGGAISAAKAELIEVCLSNWHQI
jgi:hypothetical protein